jgi:TatD DNase family protein
MIETDSPYLTPVPYRGKRNEPSYIPLIAQKIAEILNISIEEVGRITTANAKKLFDLPID